MITRSTIVILLQLCTSVLLQRDRGPPDVTATERQFRVVYEWRTLDFGFKSEQERSAAIFRGEYIPRNVIMSDVKPYANRLYIVSIQEFYFSRDLNGIFLVNPKNAPGIARNVGLHNCTRQQWQDRSWDWAVSVVADERDWKLFGVAGESWHAMKWYDGET